MKEFRCGIGFDAHAFTKGRKLILAGVKIDYPLGLAGHSDADVLTHAVIDALLGAAGMGDIGRHFPDTDPKYKGISSLTLLEQTMEILGESGWSVSNIDATIIAQKPKLLDYIETMADTLAASIKIGSGRVNIKATTTEKLGFAGREEGIAAIASVSIFNQTV